jgi:hypothetical protein
MGEDAYHQKSSRGINERPSLAGGSTAARLENRIHFKDF